MVGQAPGAHDALIGTTLGSYRVLAKIGQGGMGAVYVAEHPVIGRRVAVKVILPQFAGSPELIGRFHNEARAAAQLRHPGFVDVFDFGTLPDGSAYLVMDFLEGQSLAAAMVRVVRLPVGMVLGLVRQIAVAVGVAHDHGIVHRDLKPDNVFLTPSPDGSGLIVVKVLDFGVAKLTQAHDEVGPVTRTGMMLGTPLYMAPEQCRGAGKVDHRSDIYSLGCIVHAMLTGKPPFPLDGVGEVIGAHIYQAPPGVRQTKPDLPDAVEGFVLRCLAKDPAARPGSMSTVAAAIDALRTDLGLGPEALQVSTSSLGLLPGGAAASIGEAPVRDGQTSALPRTGTVVFPDPPPASGPSTTLGQSAAALSVVSPSSGGKRGLHMALGVIAAGVVALLALVLARSPSGPREPIPVGVVSHTPVTRAASPPPTQMRRVEAASKTEVEVASEAPRVPGTVRITIGSVPSGAAVIDPSTGDRLGNTPLDRPFERRVGMLEVSVEKPGYQSRTAKVSLERDGAVTVKLTRRAIAAPRAAPPAALPSPGPVSDPRSIRKL